ncbi:MAG: DUF3859 domain-containing protein [Alphaproteobacteria bacterium]|nr:DUF3859 domain-containing protein [Alphaproteobacteria bacterium]
MPRWLICLAAILIAGPAFAVDVTSLEIVDFGLYRARTTGKQPAPQAVNGQTQTITDIDFYETTSRIPARTGVRFGTHFRVAGMPPDEVVQLRSVWRIPEPGIRNPDSGIVYRESISEFTTTTGTLTMRGFNFGFSWQVLCGEWVQEVWSGERKLLSQTFIVEDCQSVPTAARRAAAPAG